MKKILSIVIILILLLSIFVGCVKPEEPDDVLDKDPSTGDNTDNSGNNGGNQQENQGPIIIDNDNDDIGEIAVIEKETVTVSASSDSLYVSKIADLSNDFIMGMDASSVPSLEAGGVKYYDYDGTENDVYKVLAQNGINYIRVRVWVDPFDEDGNGYGGGNCDINTALEIGKRATKYGMKLLVNFHYSDFWADPSKQQAPKAWENMNINDKVNALYKYTKESLILLKKAGVDVGMVQIGNETNGGKICGESSWKNACYLFNAGSKAVRKVFPEALVALHFANPEKTSNYKNYSFNLDKYGVDYDVFASSYYPYWHGSLENLAEILGYIAKTYNKKVMVAETSYAYTPEDTDFYGNTISDAEPIQPYAMTVQGQANLVRDLIDTVNRIEGGIGVFYWEGTWISAGGSTFEENQELWYKYGSGWATPYAGEYDPDDAGKYPGGCAVDNQAFFDKDGKPLESLKIFALVREGTNVENKPDSVELSTAFVTLGDKIELPTQVQAIYSNNERKSIDVTWNEIDEDAIMAQGAAKHEIRGVADGMSCLCVLTVLEKNYLEDYSFENGSDKWIATAIGKMDEFKIEDKVSDSLTGTKHYHFWSANKNTVEFTIEQTAEEIPAGEYKFIISIMGGDAGETEIYAYVKINGEIAYKEDMVITKYGEWDTATIEGINYNGTDEITVGIYVKCEGSGNGAWGKIDDAMLNLVKGAN